MSFPHSSVVNDGNEPLVFEGYARPAVDLDRFLTTSKSSTRLGRPAPLFTAHLLLRHRHTQIAY